MGDWQEEYGLVRLSIINMDIGGLTILLELRKALPDDYRRIRLGDGKLRKKQGPEAALHIGLHRDITTIY